MPPAARLQQPSQFWPKAVRHDGCGKVVSTVGSHRTSSGMTRFPKFQVHFFIVTSCAANNAFKSSTGNMCVHVSLIRFHAFCRSCGMTCGLDSARTLGRSKVPATA